MTHLITWIKMHLEVSGATAYQTHSDSFNTRQLGYKFRDSEAVEQSKETNLTLRCQQGRTRYLT